MSLRIGITAGPRAYPWAKRLAEAWRRVGLQVVLRSAKSGQADMVRIRARDGESLAWSVLFLDRRKHDVVSGYAAFQEAARRLRLREPVDFEALVDQTYEYMERWHFRGQMRRFANTWRALERWLESRSPAALVTTLWHLTEVYPFGEVYLFAIKNSLLTSASDRPAPLLEAETRRLILKARTELLENLRITSARHLLREAAALCRETGDEGLALRVRVLRAAALIESGEREGRRGSVALAQVHERAKALGDGPLFLETVETIAYLESWWQGSQKALSTLDAAASFAERRGWWTPPRLDHLRRLHRARLHPSAETIQPLVDELLELLDRGDGSWMDSLDHLQLLRDTLGAESFVEQLSPFFGEDNALRLLETTRYGMREDEERRTSFEAREIWRERERKLAMDPLRYFAPGG